jgi:hypothetical protein
MIIAPLERILEKIIALRELLAGFPRGLDFGSIISSTNPEGKQSLKGCREPIICPITAPKSTISASVFLVHQAIAHGPGLLLLASKALILFRQTAIISS